MAQFAFVQNLLAPGEDAEFIHRFELLQGPSDASPGEPFDPPQYQDWSGWGFSELVYFKPPTNQKRKTRIPSSYGSAVFEALVAVYGDPTNGRLVISAATGSTLLAQEESELFGDLWAFNPSGDRKKICTIRLVVQKSVWPDGTASPTIPTYLISSLATGAVDTTELADGAVTAVKTDFNSEWNGASVFQLGTYRLWVDATGDLRIKNGAPTTDLDGTVVGTQT